MKRILVRDYKQLIRELHDIENCPMNAVVRFNSDFEIELTSDFYPASDDQYTLGRACDVAEWLGCLYDEPLTDNLYSITLDTAKWLTSELTSIMKDYEFYDN
jgi:hypothetical protein